MKPKQKRPRHSKFTLFVGEVQIFESRMLKPDDPSLEPRERQGRPPNPYFQGDKGKNNSKKK